FSHFFLCLALSSSVDETLYTIFLILGNPAVDLLIGYPVFLHRCSIVSVMCDTVADNFDSFIQRSSTTFGHIDFTPFASGGTEYFMTIIQFYPLSELPSASNFILMTYIIKTSFTSKIVLYC